MVALLRKFHETFLLLFSPYIYLVPKEGAKQIVGYIQELFASDRELIFIAQYTTAFGLPGRERVTDYLKKVTV